ncbi:MAG TPA: STAS/SEC14 domain-containing protein [Longimicrobiales bacterium]
MDRTQTLEYRGRRIVLLDFTGLREEATALTEIEKARQFFARQKPDGALLTMTDGSGATYTSKVVEALKQLATHNKPYVKAAAGVSDSRLHRVVIAAIAVFTGRHIPVFATREEAMAWLIQQ